MSEELQGLLNKIQAEGLEKAENERARLVAEAKAQADAIVAMNLPSMLKFESEVKPGGVLVVNSSLIDRKCDRDDIKVIYCDANNIAESVKNPKGANVAILGALMAADDVCETDKMIEAIRLELGERKARFLEGNKAALAAGMEAAK